jgi:hypothetical protein
MVRNTATEMKNATPPHTGDPEVMTSAVLVPVPADLSNVLGRCNLVLDTVLPVGAGRELLPHHHRYPVIHAAYRRNNHLIFFLIPKSPSRKGFLVKKSRKSERSKISD